MAHKRLFKQQISSILTRSKLEMTYILIKLCTFVHIINREEAKNSKIQGVKKIETPKFTDLNEEFRFLK